MDIFSFHQKKILGYGIIGASFFLINPSVLAQSSNAILEEVHGVVKVRRAQDQNQSYFSLIDEGEELGSGDMLELDLNSIARVRCPDGTIWMPPIGTISSVNNGCTFYGRRRNF